MESNLRWKNRMASEHAQEIRVRGGAMSLKRIIDHRQKPPILFVCHVQHMHLFRMIKMIADKNKIKINFNDHDANYEDLNQHKK